MATSKKSIMSIRIVRVIMVILIIVLNSPGTFGQIPGFKWAADGKSYYRTENGEIVQYPLPEGTKNVILSRSLLTPSGKNSPMAFSNYFFSDDHSKILLYTNTERVWRINTRGSYWVADLKAGTLNRLGKTFPASSLMFAKFSPDGKSVAYVYKNNIYSEDLATSAITQLTADGTTYLINGTFDWVYEEEFFCRDGFRWSPDSKSIAYWQIDASKIRKFYMINNTDSVYSRIVPVEYPKVGWSPSPCRLGVVSVTGGNTMWLNIPGDPAQNYIVRMEFIPSTSNLLIQQLNRKQNHSTLYICDSRTGSAKVLQEESDKAWVDLNQGENEYSVSYTNNFTWLEGNKSILWMSEKDGWRHLFRIPLDGKPENLSTKGSYDVIAYKETDPKGGYVYFTASPQNATEKYLCRTKLDGKGTIQRLTPDLFTGTNDYLLSPGCKYAMHHFSNVSTPPQTEFVSLPDHKPLVAKDGIEAKIANQGKKSNLEFFKITTADSVTMDGWMAKPANFDPNKKYPVVFYVYTEPASTTVVNTYGAGNDFLYRGDMVSDGYIYISVDNRGTPAPKGREWRKSIYRNIGQINIHDQAMAAREILKWSFVDTSRIAVWGWSGGGSATLNLMFQYPDIYKTGISIAAVTSLLNYDNIYTERYMGLPQENMEDYLKGSPLTYAKSLKGKLLYIHGTGDDNVHYQNAEMLLNELVKYNKQFRFMAYPNRTHGLSEGAGTFVHLVTLYTDFLRQNCPPGGR